MRWIIGDIHGMLRPLETLLEAIGRADSHPTLYFVGDYVNRGPDSRRVIDLLLTLKNARFIRGNHDDLFDYILGGIGYSPNAAGEDRIDAFRWFMQYGLDRTLVSYGASMAELVWLVDCATPDRLAETVQCVPAAHRQFISALPALIEDPDLFVVHGYWDPDDLDQNLDKRLAGSANLRQELLWGRFNLHDILRPKRWQRPGYFGHTSVENYTELLATPEFQPIRSDHLILLDTGAALSPEGRLTAFCHETGQFIQAEHSGPLVPEGK